MTVRVDPKPLRHLVGGEYLGNSSTEFDLSVNPSSPGDYVTLAPIGGIDEVTTAIGAASEALKSWRRLPGPARAEHLYRWAEVIEEHGDRLTNAIVREVGKPLGEAHGEVGRCVVILKYYAGEAVREIGSVIPSQFLDTLQFTVREPLGVVGLITPWNFPLAIPLWKAAPALAFGNTVVLKPAEESSYITSLLAETARLAELPQGIFNVVYGTGDTGRILAEADGIGGISFTGSTEAGEFVATTAARRNIRYQTEMGGKNVVIVDDDADLRAAARLTAAGAMRFAGQKCTATSRAIVLRSVASQFTEFLLEEVDSLSLGPVTDPDSAVGPLISEIALERVRTAISAATEASAELLRGGQLPEDSELRAGFYITPAVLRAFDHSAPLAQDEIFGPVLGIYTVDELEEGIELANQTRYGLSASLFSQKTSAVLDYISRIKVGLVRVNGDTTGVDPHAPFGGFKASSSGSREQGPAAREFFTETKTIQVQR